MTNVERVNAIIKANRTLKARTAALEAAGFPVFEKAMGSGGVGRVKGNVMQVSYGWSKHNYALVVAI